MVTKVEHNIYKLSSHKSTNLTFNLKTALLTHIYAQSTANTSTYLMVLLVMMS